MQLENFLPRKGHLSMKKNIQLKFEDIVRVKPTIEKHFQIVIMSNICFGVK